MIRILETIVFKIRSGELLYPYLYNIAEGGDRGSAKDYVKFLYIAKGSATEVKNMLYIAHEFSYISTEQKELFINDITIIIAQIGRFIQYLKSKL